MERQVPARHSSDILVNASGLLVVKYALCRPNRKYPIFSRLRYPDGGSGLHAIKRAMALLEWLIVAAAAFGGYFPERLHTPPAIMTAGIIIFGVIFIRHHDAQLIARAQAALPGPFDLPQRSQRSAKLALFFKNAIGLRLGNSRCQIVYWLVSVAFARPCIAACRSELALKSS